MVLYWIPVNPRRPFSSQSSLPPTLLSVIGFPPHLQSPPDSSKVSKWTWRFWKEPKIKVDFITKSLFQCLKCPNRLLKPTFFSGGVGWTGGRRNSSESGPGSSDAPQSKEFCPGINWRVTYVVEDSEDQGSEAWDNDVNVHLCCLCPSNPVFFLMGVNISICTYRHQHCERSPPLLGQPIPSSWKVKARCHLVTLCKEKYTLNSSMLHKFSLSTSTDWMSKFSG